MALRPKGEIFAVDVGSDGNPECLGLLDRNSPRKAQRAEGSESVCFKTAWGEFRSQGHVDGTWRHVCFIAAFTPNDRIFIRRRERARVAFAVRP